MARLVQIFVVAFFTGTTSGLGTGVSIAIVFFFISLRRRVSRLFRRGARETGIVCLLLFLERWAYIEGHAYGHGVWAWIEFSMVHLHYRIFHSLHVSLFGTTFLGGEFADSITLTVIFFLS